jgi:sterol desaturase/sphingolipid hydroxylase (fatty acid hydroxylase superfamily)
VFLLFLLRRSTNRGRVTISIQFITERALLFLPPAAFLALLVIERIFPLRRARAKLVRRLLANFVLTALVFLAGSFAIKPVGEALTVFNEQRSFGLLGLLSLGSGFSIVAGFLLMDLTFYWWHRINHIFPILWRFHSVHHLDPDLDVTTAFRFHFVEIIYSAVFRVVQIGVIGITPATYLIYETCFTMATIFHHSNLRLPLKLERALNLVIVTPRMHGIHHSKQIREANSNYSVIFRWWDRLHRTLVLDVHQQDIDIGVFGYSAEDDNRLQVLLVMPFVVQRKYWADKKEIIWGRGVDSARKNVIFE